ncbi:MAG: glycosyltransferase family 39 protein, partial [Cytophagales bacterium]|nr:glycosyltransferase family 39 protein [Armatimonadota bacterium]
MASPRADKLPGTVVPSLIALAVLLLHLTCLTQYGVFRDEFYYLDCSRHLAWGYVDHPPFSIAVLAALRGIFGQSLAVVRLPVVLIHGAIVLLVGDLVQRRGGGRFAQALACLATSLAPVYLSGMHYYSMNAFDVLLWTAAASLLVRLLPSPTLSG